MPCSCSGSHHRMNESHSRIDPPPAPRGLTSHRSLPANAADSVYVAWGLTADGRAIPLGTFDVGRPEEGPLPVGADGAADDFPQYAVSIEPGRVAPTTPTVVVASGAVAV